MTLLIYVIILGFLQATSQININFLALFVIFAGLKKGPVWGLAAGIIIGGFAEILSPSSTGLSLMLYSAAGFLSGIISRKIYYKEGAGAEFLFSFFGILFFYLAYFAFTKTIQTGVFFTVIFSSLISPLLFRAIE